MGPSLSQCRPTATTILAIQKKVFVTYHCQNPCNLCGKVLSKIFATKRGKLLHESLSSKRCKPIPITFDTVPVVEDVSVENRVSHCKSGQRECCSSFSPLCASTFLQCIVRAFLDRYLCSTAVFAFVINGRLLLRSHSV